MAEVGTPWVRAVLMRLPSWVRVALRRGLVVLFRLAGLLGWEKAARGRISVRHGDLRGVARKLPSADTSASFVVEEQRPQPKLVSQHGPPISPRPIRTAHLVIETADRQFSFRNNVMLDGNRRAITEERNPWDELPVSFSPLESTSHCDGTVAYLSNTNVANFYHWMTLTLPLLRIYRERLGLEPDWYYVGRPTTRWHRETLGMLGIAEDRIVSHGVTGDRLLAAISNRQHGAVDTDALRYVREHIGRPHFASAQSRRLFVGRGTVEFRRFLNEDECFELLAQRYGFEYVTMDGLTVAEEVALFSSAECIVGVDGAALTNLLWAAPTCRVLDLFPFGWNEPHFQELAAFVGCPYAYVVGRADTPGAVGPDKPDSVRRENDVLIDPEKLIDAAEALGFGDAG